MRTRDVERLLTAATANRLPILLTGAPGVGKSDLVSQAADANEMDIIVSHPVVADPTDAKGLPWAVTGKDGSPDHATFLPFGDLAKAIRAERPTIWFLDDLGQASPAVQASYMQLLLARRVNGHVLPDCITFVAATNRRTDRAGVTGILEPVKSRFASIIEVEANLDDWTTWAMKAGIPDALIAFLRFRPDLLHQFNPTADLVNQPSPRTWANAAKLVKCQLPAALELAALQGAVGEGPAAEFTAFLRIWREMPNLDAILIDPDAATIPDQPAALYAVSVGLSAKATATNFARIARYSQRIAQNGHGEFSVLMLRDCVRRAPEVCATPAFIALAASEIGQLITGGDQ